MSHVLVVDDEVISLLTLSRCLTDAGYNVQSAKSGTEAIKCVEKQLPDVLLTDWKLGDEIDGLEVISKLSAMNPKLKSILISGLSPQDLPQESFPKDLIYRFLVKPCSLDDVMEAVRCAIEGKASAKSSA